MKIPGPSEFVRYVKEIRKFVYVSIALFAIFFVAGFLIALGHPGISNYIVDNFKESVSPFMGLSDIQLMLVIFANNSGKSLLAVLLGPFFGLVPAGFISANGLLIGVICEVIVAQKGIVYTLVGVLPHGVIELPMLWISSAIGLKLGFVVVDSMANGRKVSIKEEFLRGMKFFVFWVVPLFFLAAIIETYVTAALLSML
jgi:stage II sporulation protein M